jgi:hypothetical protein
LSFNNSAHAVKVRFGVDSSYIYLYVGGVVTSTHRVADGHWHNVCLTVDHVAGETKVYVDGVAEINHVASLDMDATDLFTIGVAWDAVGVIDSYFDGRMDEVSCWNKTLSTLDIQEIWNDGDATDLSDHTSAATLQGWWTMGDDPLDDATGTFGSIRDQTANGNNATPYGTTNADIISDSPNATAYQNSLSVVLDGVNEYFEVGSHTDFDFYDTPGSVGLPFTLSGWVKFSDVGSQGILSKMNPAVPSFKGWAFGSSSAWFYFYVANSWTGTVLGTYSNVGVVGNGAWRHLVVTYDGSGASAGVNMYVDGTDSGLTAAYNSLGSASIVVSQDVNIGNWFGTPTSYGWAGNLDEISVWNKKLSGGEVTDVYNSGAPTDLNTHSAAADLLGWWRMGDGNNGAGLFDSADSTDPIARVYNMSAVTTGSHNATPVNTEAIDIVVGVP